MTAPACFRPIPGADQWHPSAWSDYGDVVEYERLAYVGGEPVRVVVDKDRICKGWIWHVEPTDGGALRTPLDRWASTSEAAQSAADTWLASHVARVTP